MVDSPVENFDMPDDANERCRRYYLTELRDNLAKFIEKMRERREMIVEPAPYRLASWSIEYAEGVIKNHDESMEAI